MLEAERDAIVKQLAAVSLKTTLAKVRHETVHQLLHNSGLMKPGRDYPFWLAEGLAMCFEPVDEYGAPPPTVSIRRD